VALENQWSGSRWPGQLVTVRQRRAVFGRRRRWRVPQLSIGDRVEDSESSNRDRDQQLCVQRHRCFRLPAVRFSSRDDPRLHLDRSCFGSRAAMLPALLLDEMAILTNHPSPLKPPGRMQGLDQIRHEAAQGFCSWPGGQWGQRSVADGRELSVLHRSISKSESNICFRNWHDRAKPGVSSFTSAANTFCVDRSCRPVCSHSPRQWMRPGWRIDKHIDSRRQSRCNSSHGGSAIPPRGDMPKYRVPFLSRGRNHVIPNPDIP
jgi:hypothetical protein